jgi:hypothetical protein
MPTNDEIKAIADDALANWVKDGADRTPGVLRSFIVHAVNQAGYGDFPYEERREIISRVASQISKRRNKAA